MDFARKQLEKYGWTDGKGLGKHENGISEALKPKLKRSVTGVGHDAAAEFNEHWWSALYDKAAQNVEVTEKNGKTKKIKTKDADGVTISSSTWKINKKPKNTGEEEQYKDYFVRTAVLSGGSKTENVKCESESETEDEKKDVFKMTDEELFAACEGRTAHKGARHGLKALGKLARIEQQEKMLLLQPQYEGYSHAKKLKQKPEQVMEEMTLSSEETVELKKKKKKKKRCNQTSALDEPQTEAEQTESLPEKLKNEMNIDVASDENVTDCGRNTNGNKKKKKRKLNDEVNEQGSDEVVMESKKKKKKKKVKEL